MSDKEPKLIPQRYSGRDGELEWQEWTTEQWKEFERQVEERRKQD